MMHTQRVFFVAGMAAILSGCLTATAPASQDDWDMQMMSGNALAEQGRLTEAEQHYLGAVKDAGTPTPGDTRIDTRLAATLNNLGALYHQMSRYADAESAYQQSLVSLEQQLGTTHPLLAAGLNNLAWLYTATSRYDKGEPLYRRALAIAEQTLGKDNPVLAQISINLALLLEAQSRYGEAEDFHLRVLAIVEQSLGSEHPDLATCLENYAELLRKMHQDAKAGAMEARAKTIRDRLGHGQEEATEQVLCGKETQI